MAEVFSMVPPPARSMGWSVVILLIPLAVTLLIAYLVFGSQRAQFEVTREGLRISRHLYGRHIPAEALLVEQARVVNLTGEPDLRPNTRTNGIGLPGYQAGWFRLRNRQKALLFVTDRERVVYLPTTQGYAVLLSVDRPEDFLSALRAFAGV